jgi:hypothetical protein
MKKILIVTAFALSSTVANAACPSGYTSHGPFCAVDPSRPADGGKPVIVLPVKPQDPATFAERFGEWPELTSPRSIAEGKGTPASTFDEAGFTAAYHEPVVELPPIEAWTAGTVPVPHTKGPFMEAYGDTTKPPFAPDENATPSIARRGGTSQQ